VVEVFVNAVQNYSRHLTHLIKFYANFACISSP